jgi:hypothetical protein
LATILPPWAALALLSTVGLLPTLPLLLPVVLLWPMLSRPTAPTTTPASSPAGIPGGMVRSTIHIEITLLFC